MSVTEVKFPIGALATASVTRRKPMSAALHIPAAPIIPQTQAESCIILKPDGRPTLTAVQLTICYHISRFYPLDGHHDINPGRLMVSCAGIIANCVRWAALDPWTPMQIAFAVEGIKIEWQELTAHQVHNLINTDKRFKEFLDLFPDDLGFLLSKTYAFFVMGCIIILAMGKNIQPQGYVGWMTNRVKGFMGALGDNRAEPYWSSGTFPPIVTMMQYNAKIGASFDVKKQAFLTVLSTALSPLHNFVQKGFNEIVNLLRGSEMNHLVMIDKYIFSKYRELLCLSWMGGLRTVYAEAMVYLDSLPEDERMYVRLLYNKDQTALLNRQRFDVYATVATAVAQFESSTYSNYFINETESHKRHARLVTAYLNHRANLVAVAAGDEAVKLGGMGVEEQKKFFAKVCEEFEQQYNKDKTEGGGGVFEVVGLAGALVIE